MPWGEVPVKFHSPGGRGRGNDRRHQPLINFGTPCRLTVDFTKLNKFMKRPTHPVRGAHDAIASVECGARFFTKIDSKSGYHQVAIRTKDQDLTTFMTPWGRYRYRRALMGLISSGDVYNQRGDQILGDIPPTCKVVDDVLAWDTDYNEHIKHVWKILQCCDDNGITLNGDKFVFGADRVEFCGYEISADGYSPDQKKTRAIAEFPQPGCITDLRSFLGLVHQLGEFSPEISAAAEPLRQLLRPKNVWIWTEDHTIAFNNVKKLLVSPPVLGFFDSTRRTVLETDAARLKGLGFCLRQQDEHGNWKLIQCGSRFLSETESRYATIEVELLALTWAAKKCSIYLKGMQSFEVVTDHRPLVPILSKKSLQDIENPRLQRLRELLTPYNFTATWRKGALHNIPDALSRYPVDPPSPPDEDVTLQVGSLVTRIVTEVEEDGGSQTPFEDVTLTAIRAASERDPDIRTLKDVIMSGFPDHKSEVDLQVRPYWSVRDKLCVDDDLVVCGHRLVVPKDLRKSVLQSLHASHQGEVRTKRRARQTVYWPGIDQDISNVIKTCKQCQVHQPAQQKEPIIQEQRPVVFVVKIHKKNTRISARRDTPAPRALTQSTAPSRRAAAAPGQHADRTGPRSGRATQGGHATGAPRPGSPEGTIHYSTPLPDHQGHNTTAWVVGAHAGFASEQEPAVSQSAQLTTEALIHPKFPPAITATPADAHPPAPALSARLHRHIVAGRRLHRCSHHRVAPVLHNVADL